LGDRNKNKEKETGFKDEKTIEGRSDWRGNNLAESLRMPVAPSLLGWSWGGFKIY